MEGRKEGDVRTIAQSAADRPCVGLGLCWREHCGCSAVPLPTRRAGSSRAAS